MADALVLRTGIKTTKNKEFALVYTPTGSVSVAYVGGGQVSEKLGGIYTSQTEARRAINLYLKRNG